jgi:acyl dehydratase
VYAEELRPHHRGTEAVVVTEARLDGEVVWRDRSAYLARHRTDLARHRTDDSEPAAVPAAREPLPVVEEWALGADLGRRHAAVSGDYNPIHLYALTARPLGFRRPIAHGMWTFARCLAMAPAPGAPVVARAEFRAPVLLPGTVTYAAEGDAFELRSGGREGSGPKGSWGGGPEGGWGGGPEGGGRVHVTGSLVSLV